MIYGSDWFDWRLSNPARVGKTATTGDDLMRWPCIARGPCSAERNLPCRPHNKNVLWKDERPARLERWNNDVKYQDGFEIVDSTIKPVVFWNWRVG